MPFSDVTTVRDPPYGDTGPRRVNGKIVPRHLIVFHTPEEKIIHLTVEYTVRIGDIYKKIEECVGYAVFLQQTDKKNKTVILDPDEIAEDGMNFGYSVQVKRRKPKLESHFAENVAERSWTRRLYEIPGVLRATADSTHEAKSANEGNRSTAPVVKRRRPPPEWAPRGAPGGHFLAQFPPKYDADGNRLPTEYQEVYWHQGM
jgi:hypothetical protein